MVTKFLNTLQASDGGYYTIASDGNGNIGNPDSGAIGASGTASVSSATTLFSVDTSGFGGISVQVTSAGTTCTITYETSNDNSTWSAVAMFTPTVGAGGSTTSTTTGVFCCPTSGRYFRARVSTYTSGTVTVFWALRNSLPLYGTGNLQSSGNSATLPAGHSFNHISTNATTVVKSGSGVLHSISINTSGATDTATVYDNTSGSGTIIGILSTASPVTLIYDVSFNTGLTIVTAGTTPPDLTVSYR